MAELLKWKNDLDEFIFRLGCIEQYAASVYQQAAIQMENDQLFSSFLFRMGDDEELHYTLLAKAEKALLQMKSLQAPSITIDDYTMRKLIIPLERLRDHVSRHRVSRREVLNCIVKAEFSEWNYLFVYLFRLLESSKVFQYVAAIVEAHRERAIKFIKDLPSELKHNLVIPRSPALWKHKLLIVDGRESDKDLFSKILARLGNIEDAGNAVDGLEKIRDNFYNVIISGTHLPGMDVIDFYRKAVESEPQSCRRFLFCTEGVSLKTKDFFRENHLPYLEKPFGLRHLGKMVQDIIEKSL